jgi:hypothetical protein
MAAAALSHEQLIAAFEARFDFLTARTMLNEVLDSAHVGKAGSYDAAALAKIGTAVEKLSRPQPILERLHGGSAKPAEAAPAPKAEVKAEAAKPTHEAKPAEEAKPAAEAAMAEDGKADAAPAEAAKPEAKAEGDKHDGEKKAKK